MNGIVNNLLLAGDETIAEMHLRKPGFIYSACGPSTKNKERIEKFKETGDTRYIYRNELDKAIFPIFFWLMVILMIYVKEQLMIRYYVIKLLISLKIKTMIDIKEVFLQCLIISLIKN